jgi:hypothetical protein
LGNLFLIRIAFHIPAELAQKKSDYLGQHLPASLVLQALAEV